MTGSLHVDINRGRFVRADNPIRKNRSLTDMGQIRQLFE